MTVKIPVKRYFLPAHAPHNLSAARESPNDTEYVTGVDYDALFAEFREHMWWERTAAELQKQRDTALKALDAKNVQIGRLNDDVMRLTKAVEFRDTQLKAYQEVEHDHRRLVRELDVTLNGERGAARQASLCDILAQVKSMLT